LADDLTRFHDDLVTMGPQFGKVVCVDDFGDVLYEHSVLAFEIIQSTERHFGIIGAR
jgi:hypothetical protein